MPGVAEFTKEWTIEWTAYGSIKQDAFSKGDKWEYGSKTFTSNSKTRNLT